MKNNEHAGRYNHRIIHLVSAGLLVTAAVACQALLSGCEGSAVESESAILVTPDRTELMGVGATIVLTASLPTPTANTAFTTNTTLFLPLSWEATDNVLGGILESGGNSAVYQSNGQTGQNAIIVRDSSGREGIAVIEQRPVPPDPTATPVAPVATPAPIPEPTPPPQ